ncbi:hypothetical protein CWE09_07420 [Aliidiomarina minuta]|uniref:SnoaL-like domain-containing protein n=1 Tax=Aliidiomarina minuta TaxID=880057 RepID=A0A432WA97_9GAMM|nr:hypothetical protein [Aliidiomarina minuta]RUO26528.1 hypothetical protein CWE09_07420 [Aliidiomarina minuta]
MVENIAVAMEAKDTEFLSDVLDPETVWNDGIASLTSAEQILSQVSSRSGPDTVTIDHAMSHGKVGAVNGISINGEIEQRFCYVIEFTSTKCNRVRRLESYRG